jgi:hypothetical protein
MLSGLDSMIDLSNLCEIVAPQNSAQAYPEIHSFDSPVGRCYSSRSIEMRNFEARSVLWISIVKKKEEIEG